MKRILFFTGVLCFFVVLAVSPPCPAAEPVAANFAAAQADNAVCLLAGKGCCSWHGGQCGCSQGRVVCCDGSMSPTCRCRADDRPDIPTCKPEGDDEYR
ncbi:MAG: hypothetical protein V3573_14130 [Desulfovibrionaceae bacterium]